MNLLPIDEVKKLKTMLVGGREPPPKFGSSDGSTEDKCKEIQVFMIAVSGLNNLIGVEGERRRKLMAPDTTLRETRKLFGSEVAQDMTKDEYGFTFVESDLDLPIKKFSNQCKLNVNFVFSSRGQLDSYSNVLGHRPEPPDDPY